MKNKYNVTFANLLPDGNYYLPSNGATLTPEQFKKLKQLNKGHTVIFCDFSNKSK